MKTKILAMMFPLFLGTASINANTTPKHVEVRVTENAPESSKQIAHDLQIRLDKIQNLDYNSLSKDQKQDVRKEIKSIKKEARRAEGVYIYLGSGLLLVAIIILLIVLL
jgi:hypothetical protein